MGKNIIWCEVSCGRCGAMLASSGYYSPGLIKKIKAESKDWTDDPEYRVLCPKCRKEIGKIK